MAKDANELNELKEKRCKICNCSYFTNDPDSEFCAIHTPKYSPEINEIPEKVWIWIHKLFGDLQEREGEG